MESSTRCKSQPGYLKTVPGLMKIFELMLSGTAFGLAVAVVDHTCMNHGKRHDTFAYASFVAIFGFVKAFLCLSLHFLMTTNWGWPRFLETGFYALWTIAFTISGIICAVHHNGHCSSQKDRVAAAAAAFAFFSMLVWAIDTLFQVLSSGDSESADVTPPRRTGGHTNTAMTDIPQQRAEDLKQ